MSSGNHESQPAIGFAGLSTLVSNVEALILSAKRVHSNPMAKPAIPKPADTLPQSKTVHASPRPVARPAPSSGSPIRFGLPIAFAVLISVISFYANEKSKSPRLSHEMSSHIQRTEPPSHSVSRQSPRLTVIPSEVMPAVGPPGSEPCRDSILYGGTYSNGRCQKRGGQPFGIAGG